MMGWGSPRAGVETPTYISLGQGTALPDRQLARGRAGLALVASPPRPARCSSGAGENQPAAGLPRRKWSGRREKCYPESCCDRC